MANGWQSLNTSLECFAIRFFYIALVDKYISGFGSEVIVLRKTLLFWFRREFVERVNRQESKHIYSALINWVIKRKFATVVLRRGRHESALSQTLSENVLNCCWAHPRAGLQLQPRLQLCKQQLFMSIVLYLISYFKFVLIFVELWSHNNG